MDSFAVQNMLRNCRGLPPQQQQQQRKVVEEEDSEDDSSYSASSDASEDSDLTNDHEDDNNHTHPSTVRKQVFKSNPVPSGGKTRHPNSAFMVMTPRKQHQQQQNHHQSNVHKGATTPSTVHMSTHGYHSPSSTIKTPDHDAPPGLANFPKIPNRPPPHAVSVPPTPGSLAEALGMKIDPDADETAYIREEGETPVPIMPWNENCSAVKYHNTGVSGSAAPRPGSLAEALGLMIDPNPDASYIRKEGEAPTPIMPWNENCSAVKYHTTSSIARPRPGSLAEALEMMIDPNPDASYIRKKGAEATPIMPWNENCSAVKYHTTSASAQPRPGSLAEALGLMIDPNPDASYIRKRGSEATPVMPWNENCSAVKYHTTLPSGRAAAPRHGSLAEALGLMIDPNPDASYIRKQGEAATPIMPWNENCSAVKYHTTLPSGGAAPQKGSLAEALGLMIDSNPEASYIRKQGEAPTPIMPWNENCSAVKYHTTRPSGVTAAPRPGSLAEALGLKIDPTPNASYIRKQGEAATPIMPWNENCSAVKYHTTRPSHGVAAAPRKGSLAEALGLQIDPSPEASYIRKQGEAATPIMPWNENCSAVKYHTTRPTGGPTAAPRKGSLAEALGLQVDPSPEASYIRKQGEAPTPIMPWNENCSAVKYHTTLPSGRGAAAAPRPGSLAEALGLKIDPNPQASYIRKQGEAATPIMPWNENCSAVKYHTTLPSGQVAGPRPGSLAEALGLKVDPNPQASYIRKEGEAATPIMPWNENCSAVKYHTTLPSGQAAGPRPGSLAEALGLKIDPNPQASYIRKEGEAATPIMPWNENCSAVKYHTTPPSGSSYNKRSQPVGGKKKTKKSLMDAVMSRVDSAQPGSLAAALGMQIDDSNNAAAIREVGRSAPPTQSHYGTTFGYSTTSGAKPKKSLMDAVISRVDLAQPGSLAAALGMQIDDSNNAAAIREVGRSAPPTQSHYGTTFGYSTTSGAKPKKSLMDVVVTRVRSNSIDEFEEENVQERADARIPKAKPKKSLTDAVVTRVRSNSIDEFDEEEVPKPKKSLMDVVMTRVRSNSIDGELEGNVHEKNHSVVDARSGSLADALAMKIDASYQAPAIREKGNIAPAVQTHYGTTFIGDQYEKSAPKKASFADMVFSRLEGSERTNYAEKQIKSERSAYSAPAPPSTPAATETLSSSPPPPVASIWMVADMTMKSRSKKQKKKKMSVP